jgi:hypothetical protein
MNNYYEDMFGAGPQDYNFFGRLFEGFPAGWEHRFEVNQVVSLIRPIKQGIPVNAQGVITEIKRDGETNYPITVQFDLSPYHIPLPPALLEVYQQMGQQPPPFLGTVLVPVGPNDIDAVLTRK